MLNTKLVHIFFNHVAQNVFAHMSDVGLILQYPATFIRRSVLQSRRDSASTLHVRVIANYDRELQERGV